MTNILFFFHLLGYVLLSFCEVLTQGLKIEAVCSPLPKRPGDHFDEHEADGSSFSASWQENTKVVTVSLAIG